MSKINIIIKLNQNPHPNNCPLCNRLTNPNIGAEAFLENTELIVCFDCVEKYSPILACLITFADFAREFPEQPQKPLPQDFLRLGELANLQKRAEEKFGALWTELQNIKKSPMNTYQNFGFEKTEVANVGH